MNSLNGVQIRGDINEAYNYQSDHWMNTEYDDNVLDYWKKSNGKVIIKMKKYDGLDCDNDVKNTLPAHLEAFTLSNRKRFMNNFSKENNDF